MGTRAAHERRAKLNATIGLYLTFLSEFESIANVKPENILKSRDVSRWTPRRGLAPSGLTTGRLSAQLAVTFLEIMGSVFWRLK